MSDPYDIGDLLDARAREADPSDDIGAMLDARARGETFTPKPPAAKPQSWQDRFSQGFMDLPTGLGQAAEHIAETPLNVVRKGIRSALNATGATEAAQIFGDVSTADFDKQVADREADYQGRRTLSGAKGVDWWRIAGGAANPLNYAVPGGTAASVAGRIGQAAAQGAAIGAAQPSTEPGNFWFDKAKGAAIGGATGGAVSGLIEGVHPALAWAAGKLSGTDNATASTAANATVEEALKAKGIDPAKVSPDVLSGMKKEVQDAMTSGIAPTPQSIANRALAESLPVPVPLTRGQATRDPILFTREQDLRGIKVDENDIGAPIRNRLVEQNRALIENINAMGAKDAPDIVSAGGQLAGHIRTVDEALKGKIDEAYDAVRNSAGQPAAMDGKTFAQSLRTKLDEDFRFLPGEVRSTIEELESGNLPLTVKRAQSLDKAWSGLQSGQPLNTTTDRAIGIAKRELLDAPLSESVGGESIQAYKVARELAKQRFDLIDANPAYEAVIKGSRNAEPENFFKRFIMNGTAREIEGIKGLTQAADPSAGETLGRSLLGEIKRTSINGSEEEGAFSGAKFGKYVNDPVWRARLDAALPAPVTESLRNLGKVAELVQRPPVGSSVNTSNTGSAIINALGSAAKSGAMEKIAGVLRFVPGFTSALKEGAKSLESSRLENEVAGALKPGVTLRQIPRLTADQMARNRTLAALVTPAALATIREDSAPDSP